MPTSNQKRILHNTAMLYMRMLLAMAVSLYTSREVLNVLGIEDFGIYQVVTGFIALLGFLQGAMTTATQRFLAFDIGKTEGKDIEKIFNTSLILHILLAAFIVLLAETAGIWFVSTQMTIPEARMTATLSAYQPAIIGFSIGVLMIPFTAMLIVHERMGIFAAIGMFDVLLKLTITIALKYMETDKLVTYTWLLAVVNSITFISYIVATKLLFPKIRLLREWHPQKFKPMISYTAWNTWGNLAAAMSVQGTNLLLNMFFGPAVNAGRSIALQANGALYSFVQNAQSAINPQIIKLFASGSMTQMNNLVLRASRYNFFILLTFSLPILLNTETLLALWLTNTPPHTTEFLQLTIIASLIDSFSGPLMTGAQATGRIRLYHTIVGGILLLNVPIGYFFLKKGHPPESVLILAITLSAIALIARVVIVSNLINISIREFISRSLARSILVAAISSVTTKLLFQAHEQVMPQDMADIAINLTGATLATIITIYYFGLDSFEKSYLIKAIKTKIN